MTSPYSATVHWVQLKHVLQWNQIETKIIVEWTVNLCILLQQESAS